jgi:nucleotide-binding universal stress UspA family protein
MATKPVVVGVDGSEESLLAAEWAAMEAKRYDRLLRIVSAPATMPRILAGQVSAATARALREVSARALKTAVSRAEEVATGLEITTELLSGLRQWSAGWRP